MCVCVCVRVEERNTEIEEGQEGEVDGQLK